MVGAMLNTRADNTKLIPREPRSIVLDRAPVCRFKWKAEEVKHFSIAASQIRYYRYLTNRDPDCEGGGKHSERSF